MKKLTLKEREELTLTETERRFHEWGATPADELVADGLDVSASAIAYVIARDVADEYTPAWDYETYKHLFAIATIRLDELSGNKEITGAFSAFDACNGCDAQIETPNEMGYCNDCLAEVIPND